MRYNNIILVLKFNVVLLILVELLNLSVIVKAEALEEQSNTFYYGMEKIEDWSEKEPMMPRGEFLSFYNILPSKYGTISKTVYDQGRYGCCWAFAGTSLFEYTVDRKNDINITYFSTEHLLQKTSVGGNCGFKAVTKDEGGYAETSATYFSSGYGPVLLEKYPWIDSHSFSENYDFGRAEYRATDIMLFYGKRNHINYELTEETKQLVKKSVYNSGAMYCNIWGGTAGNSIYTKYFDSETASFYVYDQPYRTNHAVLVVGWDDNYSKENFITKPKSDGAWLVRNSWGSDFGINGYMWVSYEDQSITPRMTILSYEEMGENEKIYNLDESGCSDEYQAESEEEGYINVFEIENNEKLSDVTFYTPSSSAVCQVFYVPINDNGKPNISEKIAISDEEEILYSGYHTIHTNQEIMFSYGTKCGIMVYVKDKINKAKIGMESSFINSKPTLNTGESFIYKKSGELIDLTSTSEKGNFSIKLVTENLSTSITECEVIKIGPIQYVGVSIPVVPTIYYQGETLKYGEDFTTTYKNNKDVGIATIEIEGIGNYYGKCETNFEITQVDLSRCKLSEIDVQCYTGKTVIPYITLKHNSVKLKEGRDYYIADTDSVNTGIAVVVVCGKGNFKNYRTITFRISNSMEDAVIEPIPDTFFMENYYIPKVTLGGVTLKQNEDYVVTVLPHYNNKIGEYSYIIIGKDKYKGSNTVTFNILARDINRTIISNVPSQVYTGQTITPSLVIMCEGAILEEGIDYTLGYKNNINIGTATITINGIGNFNGTVDRTFEIK